MNFGKMGTNEMKESIKSKINHLKKKLLMLLMFYANLFIIVKVEIMFLILLQNVFKLN
jgi:hypothetical protein